MMNLILLNLQSNQQIKLDNDTPLIIGRGNVEGCFDKRVSRNHGKITCTVDGKIRVAALHCNPCFFTRNGVPTIQQLNKDEEETLNEGDYIGLLPNAFWFKVTSNANTDNKNKPEFSIIKTDVATDEKNQAIELENCNTSSALVEEITMDKEVKCVFNNKSLRDKSSASTSNSEGSAKFGTPEFEKTKRLPIWMYQIDDLVLGKNLKKHSLEEVTHSEGKKQKISSEIGIKKEFEMKPLVKIRTEDKVSNFDIPSTSTVHKISDLPCNSENQEETPKNSIEREGYMSSVKDKDLVSKRPICQYEDKCYRKNPQHKLDFCHPEDPDFVPHEERPTCQYGAACYRQNKQHKSEFRHLPPRSNVTSPSLSLGSKGEERPPCLSGSICKNQHPQHRKEFYHPPKGYNCIFKCTSNSLVDWDSESSFDDYTYWDDFTSGHFDDSDSASSPPPEKRARRTVNVQNYEYEDDDEYDSEEPFANDASSDDFIPSDFGSEEEEVLDASLEDH